LAFGWVNRVGRRNVGGRCERLGGVEDMVTGMFRRKPGGVHLMGKTLVAGSIGGGERGDGLEE